MAEPICACGCGRPVADGYATAPCMARAGYRLAEMADTVPAARDIAHGLSNHGGTGGSGKPGSRLPLDLGATARLDAVENELTGWVRHVMEQRGGGIALPPDEDRIVLLARWLTGHLEWWRHRAEVDEFLGDVEACARVVRGIARGPAEQRYLGPCGETVEVSEHPPDADGRRTGGVLAECDGDVYGHPDAATGRCRTCGATVDQGERRAWLDGEVRQRAYRASEIEDAYGVKANLIRQWATAERGLLRVHDRDFLGRARYLLGEVLDLARDQKLKAAARAADRDRRAAARAAEGATA